MSEVTASFGLDATEFRNGLNQVGAAADKAASRMESNWSKASSNITKGLLGAVGATEFAKRTLRFAAESVREYATHNDAAAQSLGRLTAAQDEFQMSLGRGLYSFTSGFDTVGMIHKATAFYEGLVNEVSDMSVGFHPFGEEGPGHAASVDEALKEQERQSALLKLMARRRDMLSDLEIATAKLSRSQEEADTMEENRLHARNRALIRSSGGALGADSSALLRAEDQRHAAALAHIADEVDAEVLSEGRRMTAEIQKDNEQRIADAAKMGRADELLKLDMQSAQADQLRIEGRNAEADALERQVRLEREILSLRERGASPALIEAAIAQRRELAAAEARAAGASVEEVRGPARPFSGSQFIGSGLYSASAARQVFVGGGGSASDPSVKRLEEIKRAATDQLALLKQIERNTSANGATWN